MKEKIKKIYPLLLSLFIFFPLFSVYAIETSTTVGSFSINKEEICEENGKPIVYFFGSQECPHSKWELPIVKKVAEKFKEEIAFHNNMDSDADKDVFDKYSIGGIPTIVLGCKYSRVGSGEGDGEEKETKNLTTLICKLTGSKPESVCGVLPKSIGEEQISSSKEFIGTLAIPGTLRDCPSSDCKVIRYYAETAEIKIVGLDDSNEWYQVIANDDYGNKLNGWMHYSIFVDDYRTRLKNEKNGENETIFIFGQNIKEITLNNEKQLYCTPSSFITQPLKPTENTKAVVLYQIKNPVGTWFRIAIDKEPVIKDANTIYSGHCALEPTKEKIGFKYWMKEKSIPEDIRLQILDIEQFSKDTLGLQSFRVDGNYIKEKVRKCPENTCEVEWMVGNGGIATVIEEEGDWFRIVVSNFDTSRVDQFAEEGWVYKDFVPENIKTKLENYKQTISQKEQINQPSLNEKSQSAKTNWAILYYGVVIIFIAIIFSTFSLFRKKIKAVFQLKWSGINLQKIKSKRKSFVISTLVATGIAIGIIGISYGAVYYQTSKLVSETEQLTKAEKYNEAIGKLELIFNMWTVKNLGIKRQEISNKINEVGQLLVDKTEYNQGIEEFNKEDWGKAKELLSKVSETSPYYQDAKNKIEEAQNNITQQKITEAIEKATEESKRILVEAQSRVEAEAKQSQAKTAELEQKIKELQQKQPSEGWSGYKASEIAEELGKYIVGVFCVDYFGNISGGSGIIIGQGSKSESMVLTNYHVVENADLYRENPCIVAYSDNPIYGFTDFYSATPVYFPSAISESTMESIDFYFLDIKQKIDRDSLRAIYGASLVLGNNRVPVICSVNETKIGEEVVVLGYPAIGGDYLSATDGIISGLEGSYYLTTSAKIEQGNSGGGAFLKSSGCLVGMPTFVRLGKIESLARLINMSVLERDYLSRIWK